MTDCDTYAYLAEAATLALSAAPQDRTRSLALARAASRGCPWWNFRMFDGERSVIELFHTISGKTLSEALPHLQGTPVLYFQSAPGGDVIEAMNIAKHLEGRGAIGIVRDSCNSAANLVLAGCSKRLARSNSTFLIHGLRKTVCGTAARLRNAADTVDAEVATAAAYFSERTGQPMAQCLAWFTGPDLTITAEQAKNIGLIHDLLPPGDTPPAARPNAPESDDSDLALNLALAIRSLEVRDRGAVRIMLEPWLSPTPTPTNL